ncbi:DUF115 domain-containing protein, partial [Campylobacter jejuni]|nr:DUF115 domain-containing protein [Campylobacter jejuni]
NKYLPKTLTTNRGAKILNKILATFKREKQNTLICLEHAIRLNDVLKIILASDRKFPIDFLKIHMKASKNLKFFWKKILF